MRRTALALFTVCCATALAQTPVIPWKVETQLYASGYSPGPVAVLIGAPGNIPAPVIAVGDSLGIALFNAATGQFIARVTDPSVQGVISGLDARTGLDGRQWLSGVSSSTGNVFTLAQDTNWSMAPVLTTASAATTLGLPGPLALQRYSTSWHAYVGLGRNLQDFVYVDGGLQSAAQTTTPLDGTVVAVSADDTTGRVFVLTSTPNVLVSTYTSGLVTAMSPQAQSGSLTATAMTTFTTNAGCSLLFVGFATGEVAAYNVANPTKPVLKGTFIVGAPDGGSSRVGTIKAMSSRVLADLPSDAGLYGGGLLAVHDAQTATFKLVAWNDITAGFDGGLVCSPTDISDGGGQNPGGGGTGGGGAPSGGGGGGGTPPAVSCGCSQPGPMEISALTVWLPWLLLRRRNLRLRYTRKM